MARSESKPKKGAKDLSPQGKKSGTVKGGALSESQKKSSLESGKK